MHISILGDAGSDVARDTLAAELATKLCRSLSTEARKLTARHRLLVSASPTGTAEAVRQGAADGLVRHVTTYSLGPPDASILANRSQVDGFYVRQYQNALERLQVLGSGSILIILAINRRNLNIMGSALYSVSEDLRRIPGLVIDEQQILVWSNARDADGKSLCAPGDFRYHFGNIAGAIDYPKLQFFSTADQAATMVEAIAERVHSALVPNS